MGFCTIFHFIPFARFLSKQDFQSQLFSETFLSIHSSIIIAKPRWRHSDDFSNISPIPGWSQGLTNHFADFLETTPKKAVRWWNKPAHTIARWLSKRKGKKNASLLFGSSNLACDKNRGAQNNIEQQLLDDNDGEDTNQNANVAEARGSGQSLIDQLAKRLISPQSAGESIFIACGSSGVKYLLGWGWNFAFPLVSR